MESSGSGTNLNTLFVSRKELLDIMKGSGEDSFEKQYDFLVLEMENRTKCNKNNLVYLKQKLSKFKSEYRSRWMKSCRIEDKFKKNNKEWLETSLSFPVYKKDVLKNKRGRQHIRFELCAERTKRAKTQDLRDSTPVSSLLYATCMSLRSEGQVQASVVLKDIATSPDLAKVYQEAYKHSLQPKQQLFSGEEALTVLIDAKLTREQYDVIRKCAPDKFPSYKTVQTAKKLCYPKDITVTETGASVKLQALLNHTTERLCQTLSTVIKSLENENLQLCLISKWGFDGSSGHSSYKQAFCNLEADDSAVFITCLVPIRLMSRETIIWQNPSPASTRYCRPVKIEFKKESTLVSITEHRDIENEIKNLQESYVAIESKQVRVSHNLIFSMVDGKVCNAVTETTSTMKCFLCGATSKQFNKIEQMIAMPVKTENLSFGLSVLHGWIRFFECLLHLSYKLPIGKWQARGSENKQIVSENKARIQKEFREKCGLIVDKPKPGFGNSNDGNTARRFFQNPALSAEITKIDIELIKKLHIILIVVSSGFEIDAEKYRVFAQATARYFVSLYPWYYMPPTLHKYLIHGPEIIRSALLPIGQLTEESQEARNKDFKKYREHNSRKCSREKSNRDIFNFFLLSSDPVISSKQKSKNKRPLNFPKEAVDLLKVPSPSICPDKETPVEDDEEDDDDDALAYM